MLVLQNSNPVLCFLQILFCRCPSSQNPGSFVFFLVWNKKHTLTLKIFFSLQIIPSKIYPCTSLQPTRQTKNMREKILGCFFLGPNATQCNERLHAWGLRIVRRRWMKLAKVIMVAHAWHSCASAGLVANFHIFLGWGSLDWLLVSKHVYVVKPGLFVIVETGWG